MRGHGDVGVEAEALEARTARTRGRRGGGRAGPAAAGGEAPAGAFRGGCFASNYEDKGNLFVPSLQGHAFSLMKRSICAGCSAHGR